MLDFERMVRAGVEFAGTSRVTLAATYDLSEQVCRDFADRSLIAGYVANGASPQAPAVSLVTGHWTDRANGRWQLRSAGVSVLVFLGSTLDLGGRMLLAAQLAGVRRIVVVHFDGSISADINVPRALVGRLKHALVSRLLAGGIDSKLTPLTWIADQSFEKAYELLYTLFTGRLRMARDEFVPRRLLIIAGSLGPGGAERQVAYTAAAIMKSGQYEVYVGCNFLEPPSDFFRSQLEAAGVKVLSVPADAPEYRTPELTALRKQFARGDALGLQNIAYAMFHYALLIRAVRPTVVHTWMDYCNVLGGIAADIVGVPALVLGGRSLAPDHFAIFQPYMRPGYRLLLEKRPIVFLNNSRAGAQDYGRWLDVPADTVRVIPNGFAFPDGQSPQTRTDERKRLGLSSDAFVVGSIIRFSEEKRPRLILDMARVLARRYPQLQFVIFGTGPLLEDMRSCVRKWGLSDVIRLPGLTTDAWASLRALDVFVLASRMEGLPNVVIEAQASGVPVVCTAVGGTP